MNFRLSVFVSSTFIALAVAVVNASETNEKGKTTTTTVAPSTNIDPYWYLKKFGYLAASESARKLGGVSRKLSGSLIMRNSEMTSSIQVGSYKSDDEVQRAIREFQRRANVTQTGVLDEMTMAAMRMPRCGQPDINNSNNNKRNAHGRLRKRFVLQGSKWSRASLTFRVSKYPTVSIMSKRLIDEELQRALDVWGRVAGIKFELVNRRGGRVNSSSSSNRRRQGAKADDSERSLLHHLLMLSSGKVLTSRDDDDDDDNYDDSIDELNKRSADIDVRFETGYHGDSEPFDGSGLILGHAFFPEFGGSAHFDADEYWTSKSASGVNLYQVAVHEFGHSLGLEHSENYDAIMAPFFRYILFLFIHLRREFQI